jgi:hypothetical protein
MCASPVQSPHMCILPSIAPLMRLLVPSMPWEVCSDVMVLPCGGGGGGGV